jgi:hypothetical protein
MISGYAKRCKIRNEYHTYKGRRTTHQVSSPSHYPLPSYGTAIQSSCFPFTSDPIIHLCPSMVRLRPPVPRVEAECTAVGRENG